MQMVCNGLAVSARSETVPRFCGFGLSQEIP